MPRLGTSPARIGVAALVAAIVLLGAAFFTVSNVGADTIGDKNVKWGWGVGEGPAGDYDFPSEDCKGSHTDPVGALFVGKRGGVENVEWHIEKHNGWDRNVGVTNAKGEKHSLRVRNAQGELECKVLNTANANAGSTSDRFHIRLWGIPGSEFPEKMTVGTPHHEDFVVFGCSPPNHAVDPNGSVGEEHGVNASGFDWARHELKYYFSHPNEKNPSADYYGGNHHVENEYWGNSANFTQCTGATAGSDGWGVVIRINRKTDPRTKKPSAKQSAATLLGEFGGDGTTNEWWFGYGTKSAQGASEYQKATAVEASSANEQIAVSAPVSDLKPNTKYYARLFVRTEDDEVEEGAEVEFWTQAAPVAAYSFDEGEGATAEDAAGENDGTIEGAAWAKGIYGSALKFDGVDDCVSIADAPELQLSEEFTLQAWVKPEGSPSADPVIFKEDGESASYRLTLNGERKVQAFEDDEEGATSPDPLDADVWTHIAATYDGARVRVFVDGEQVESNLTGPETMASSGPLEIGCASVWENELKGRIDEVRIYDRALDAGEIAADRATPIQTPQAAPVAAYSFDQGQGEFVGDLAGEHHGALKNTDWVRGKFGSAIYLDGSNDYVEVADATDLDLTEEFTLETWVRPDVVDSWEPVIWKGTETFYSYSLGAAGETPGVPEGFLADEASSWVDVEGEEVLPANTWSHLALSFDGAHLRLYVNGELIDKEVAPKNTENSNGPLLIGATDEESFFNGRIDEVRIYDRALDAGEIAADRATPIQTPQAGPVAAYSFDQGEGELAEDLAGENDGEIEGATWTTGRYGSALLFDEEDCVTVADAPELQLTEEFTLQAWVKPDDDQIQSDPIFFKETEDFYSYFLGLSFQSNGKVEGYIGEEDEEDYTLVSSPEALIPNVWAHVALTYDGNLMRLYLNGELVDSNATAVGNVASSGPLRIGCNEVFDEYFDGRIDEPRIYDRALDAGEIAADRGTPISG
ncbi:MAG TPA: LamG domain-containing protein [Solirubrobacterales bacterium]|nr:LamG domain-containing protein [Solirubrobacterales bacterium]